MQWGCSPTFSTSPRSKTRRGRVFGAFESSAVLKLHGQRAVFRSPGNANCMRLSHFLRSPAKSNANIGVSHFSLSPAKMSRF
eukprot:6791906-Prymnesium_polylepis.1